MKDPTERRSVLRKQSEIEEVEDDDNSPSSDQSDTTITTAVETQNQSQGSSPESDSPNESKRKEREEFYIAPINGQDVKSNIEMSLLTVNPTKKPLLRSEAMTDDVSPPGERVSSGTYPEPSIISSPATKTLQVTERKYLHRSESSEAGSSSIDSSFESRDPYKDPSGIDLEDFIKKTLQKTPKDRNMLLKIEKDLTKFIKEPKHHYLKFPEMSSYDRMLVHRVAAYFGLDHNVDQTGKCVIVNKTAHTRIPDFCFKEYGGKESHQPRKILPRNGASFNEQDYRTADKQLLGELKKTQSFEERQIRYAQVRSKIFNKDGSYENPEEMDILKITRTETFLANSKEELRLQPWSSTDSSSGYATDGSVKSKGPMLKAHSYGGTPSAQTCTLQCITSSSFNKQDSVSSGASSNLGSPMPRPMISTTPPGSHSDNSSLSGSSGGVPAPVQSPVTSTAGTFPSQSTMYWIVTDAGSIPIGSIIIDPKTGQPLCNKDGSLYRYNPNQLPVSFQQIAQTHPNPQFSTVNSENQPSSSDLCQPMTSLSLQPQSSENVPLDYPPNQALQHPIVIQSAPSSISPYQQHASVSHQQHSYVQGNFIQGSAPVAGQPVQYLYQVRNPSPLQSAVSIESQGQYPQQAPQHTYIPTITYYQNNPYQLSMTTQCSDSYGTNLQTSQIQGSHQSEANIQGFTYPIAMGTLSQSQYGGQAQPPPPPLPQQHSVPTSSNPQIVYGCSGHNVFRAPTPPVQGVGVSSNSNSSVNVTQTPNVVSPASGPPPTNPQFVSFQNFRFPSQYPNPNSQILQFSPLQSPAAVQSQTFQVVRPSVQLSMPMAVQQNVVPTGHTQTVNNVKNFSTDQHLVRPEDTKDLGSNIVGYQIGIASNPSAGTFIRPPAPYTAGQSVLRPPLQSSTFSHQQHQISNSPQQFQLRQRMPINSAGKPCYVKGKKLKNITRDTAVISQTSCESDVNQTGNDILEVCELAPHLQREEADRILKDLISSGASIHYVPKESSIGSDTSNLTVSDYKMILAIFSDALSANHALVSQQCSSYVLKSTIRSGEPLDS